MVSYQALPNNMMTSNFWRDADVNPEWEVERNTLYIIKFFI
jgi:hypothetical protein